MTDISDTSYLDALDEETKFMNNGRVQAQRLKIERGCGARCRFIPARLGPRKLWFARISHYWVNGHPVMCAKDTHPDFGGTDKTDPYYDLVQKLLESSNSEVQRVAKKAAPVTQWLTYCLMLETEDSRRRQKIVPEPDCFTPYEYWLYRSNFLDFRSMYEKRTKYSNLSILDPVTGCDIWVTRTNRGIHFNREDAAPFIEGHNDDVQAAMDAIVSKIEFKQPTLPSADKLDEMCEKLKEAASRASRGRVDDDEPAPRGRSRNSDDYDDDEPTPRSRSRSRANDDDDDDEPAPRSRSRVDDDEPAPRSRSRVDDDEPAPRSRSRVDDDDPPRRTRVDEESTPFRSRANDDDDDDEPAPRSRSRVDEPQSRRSETPRIDIAPAPAARRIITPPPASAPVQATIEKTVPTRTDSSVDDEDNAPDENGELVQPAPDLPPPPVENSGTHTPRKLSAALANKLAQRRND